MRSTRRTLLRSEEKEMNLLLVPWGRNLGHLTRCLAIAKEAATHTDLQVNVVLPQRWRAVVERIGCTIWSYPEDLTSRPAWQGWEESAHLRSSLEADIHLLKQVQPDIVVHDIRPTMLIACQLLGIPCVLIAQCQQYPGFLFPGEDEEETIWYKTAESAKILLKELHLETVEKDLRELLFRHPVIIPSIPEFDCIPDSRLAEGIAAQLWYTGPLLFRDGFQTHLPVFDRNPVPPLLFIYGVVINQDDLNLLLDAFRATPFHLIISGVPDTIYPPEDSAQITLYHLSDITSRFPLDILSVLPHCMAALIHGGHGSCMTVLSSGVPAVAIPSSSLESERIYNCRQLEKMGVGKMELGCRLSHIAADRKIRETVEYITQDPAYRERAKMWQHYIRQWPGPGAAVEIITSLAASKAPPAPFFHASYA